MPTPFTHLEIAQRLLQDDHIPLKIRDWLQAERGAFLLGNIAADARVGSGAPRSVTHFYDYRDGIHEHPWRVMVNENPELFRPKDLAQQVFVAGYVAHLSVDEIWSKYMVGPHFARREWAENAFRFYMLHMILIYMDARDLPRLAPWQPASLCSATPEGWLRFASDDDLRRWRDLIYDQIKPKGESRTLEIFGERVGKPPEELEAFLTDTDKMQSGLWDHIPKTLMHEVEAMCYDHARQQMIVYLAESRPE